MKPGPVASAAMHQRVVVTAATCQLCRLHQRIERRRRTGPLEALAQLHQHRCPLSVGGSERIGVGEHPTEPMDSLGGSKALLPGSFV